MAQPALEPVAAARTLSAAGIRLRRARRSPFRAPRRTASRTAPCDSPRISAASFVDGSVGDDSQPLARPGPLVLMAAA
jgi:hypothetical protein